ALIVFIRSLGNVPVRINAFHAQGVYGEAASWHSATPADIEPLALALENEQITVIRPALYL
ncbi:YjjW family glycine radical enzyme activase, partial [Enterobacter sp. 63]